MSTWWRPTGHRRKRLLVADMELTIIEQECLDEIADYRRAAARISPTSPGGPCAASSISRRPLKERVGLLRGLDADVPRARLRSA